MNRQALTTSGLLVSIILAVFLAVAELRPGYALVGPSRATFWAQVLVVGTGDGRAVGLVRPVRAVLIPVAVVRGRDAQVVAARELADVTRREIWKIMTIVAIDFVTGYK